MSKPTHKLIEEQIKRWELGKKENRPISETISVITISRECGSRGKELATLLAGELGFDLFHNEILEAMVETSKTSRALLETLDERGMNIVDDIVSHFVSERHLWPDEYSKLLFKILTTIAAHGKAVILGRGANCVLHKKNTLRVRIVAPMAVRCEHIKTSLNLNHEDARRYITSTDADRTAFVKRYFNSDADDPSNYDLVINTGLLTIEKCVQIIRCAIG